MINHVIIASCVCQECKEEYSVLFQIDSAYYSDSPSDYQQHVQLLDLAS